MAAPLREHILLADRARRSIRELMRFFSRNTVKRFPEYEELSDGTLMRMEGSKEFRIYCEDLEEFPIRVMTKGFCTALNEALRLQNEGSP